MKRRILVAGILVMLILGLTTAATVAFALTIDGASGILLFQIDLPTETPANGGFYSKGFVFSWSSEPSSTLNWTVTPTDGGPALSIMPEGTGKDSKRAWLNLNPSETYAVYGRTYQYTIAAGFPNGDPTSTTISVFFNKAALPDSYSVTAARVLSEDTIDEAVPVNGEMNMARGQRYLFTETVGVNDVFSAYSVSTPDTGASEWDEEFAFDYPDLIINQNNQQIFKARQNGTYDHCFVAQYVGSNVACYMPYTLTISEDIRIRLKTYADQINRYLGMTKAYEDEYGVFSWNYLADEEIENYDQLQSELGGQPEWTVTQLVGDPLPYTWTTEDNGRIIDIRLEAQALADANYPSQHAAIQMTCKWGGKTASSLREITFKYPENGLPDGIQYNNGSNVVNCRVGDMLDVFPEFSPSSWSLPGYSILTFARNSGEFERFATVTTEVQEGYFVGCQLEVTTPGIYECFVGVGADTITAGRWITYRVADQNGNYPAQQPEISGYFSFTEGVDLDQNGTYFVSSGMPLDSDQDGILYSNSNLFTYGVDNWWQIKNEMSGIPTFTVTKKSGNISYDTRVWNDNSHVDVFLTGSTVPAAGSAEFEVTCTLDGQNYAQLVHIDFVPLQSKPTGVETDYADLLIAKVGSHIDLNPSVRFTNNWSIGENNWSTYGGGDFWDHVDWEYCTWSDAGVYPLQLVARADNLSMSMTVTAVVAEADGTMDVSRYTPFGTVATVPSGLKVIDSEAFAGTKLTEVDIPAGVSIAADAFRDSELIAVYTHNDPNTISWAVNNGVVALTE